MEQTSDRLKHLVEKLSPLGVEILTAHAESLAECHASGQADPPRFDWVGGLRDEPEQSGLEAQETAKRLRLEGIVRNLG